MAWIELLISAFLYCGWLLALLLAFTGLVGQIFLGWSVYISLTLFSCGFLTIVGWMYTLARLEDLRDWLNWRDRK